MTLFFQNVYSLTFAADLAPRLADGEVEAAPVATGGGGRPLPEAGGKSREVGPRGAPGIRTRFHFMKKITGSEAMCKQYNIIEEG